MERCAHRWQVALRRRNVERRPCDEQHGQDATAPLRAVERGVLRIALELEDEAPALASLMRRYKNIPMSLADACLVRMSELREPITVLTTDSDFRVYRRNGRAVIPVLMPP